MIIPLFWIVRARSVTPQGRNHYVALAVKNKLLKRWTSPEAEVFWQPLLEKATRLTAKESEKVLKQLADMPEDTRKGWTYDAIADYRSNF